MNALILAGGESKRMGTDKAFIAYHDLPQFEYLAHLLQPFVRTVFVSVRPERKLKTSWPLLIDRYSDGGPFAALMTAFDFDAHVAWLTVPCDMPDIDADLIKELFAGRNPDNFATCFRDLSTGDPEPLLAIWESKSYPILQKHFSAHASLRRVLSSAETTILEPLYPHKLMDVDTKEEQERRLKK